MSEIVSAAANLGIDAAKNFAEGKIKDFITSSNGKRSDEKFTQQLKASILNKYGNELFYNDLDGFLMNNNTIYDLLSVARNNSQKEIISENKFVNKNIKLFIKSCPKYRHEKIIISKIKKILSEIYISIRNHVTEINPYSEFGILQSELKYTAADSVQQLSDEISNCKEQILKEFTTFINTVTEVNKENLAKDCSREIKNINKKISIIQSQYQNKNNYNKAIDEYLSLIQYIAGQLIGQPNDTKNDLLCTINCNLALCYSNIGEFEKAYKTLNLISDEAANKSKIYHYVFAVIIINNSDNAKYNDAKNHLDSAIQLDHNYHRAYLLRQLVYALIKFTDLNTNINNLNNHFSEILEKNEDTDLIIDFYVNRGNIYQIYDEPFLAEQDFIAAKEYGIDKMLINYNIAVSLYNQAVRDLPKNSRLLRPKVDYEKANKSISILENMLLNSTDELDSNIIIKKRSVSLYLSICFLAGKKHNLKPIKEYLVYVDDYETKRALLMNCDEELTKEEKLLLNVDDRYLIHFGELIDQEEYKKCKREIVQLIELKSTYLPLPALDMLLQICCILKQPNEYWKYKQIAISYGMKEQDTLSMDAFVYEIEKNIDKAKTIFDKLSNESYDYQTLDNTIRFYKRNNFKEECIELYLRIKRLKEANKICIYLIDSFYVNTIDYFINIKSHLAFEFFDSINMDEITEDAYNHISLMLYSSVNDIYNLEKILSKPQNKTSFKNIFNHALCLCQLLKYDDALTICNELIKSNDNEDEIYQVYCLLSDLYLLKNDFNSSYKWVKKAHELKIKSPYDPIHQFFFSRSMRCGKDEVLIDIMEFKKTHPVVVDWFQQFSIKEDENIVETLQEKIAEFSPQSTEYEKSKKFIVEQYKKGILPINLMLEFYHKDLINFFEFSKEHKLRVSIGNINILEEEIKMINGELVVDSLTLLIMSYFNCLDSLESLNKIYITYSSLYEIRHYYLSYGFPFIVKIMQWIETCDNILFVQDGFNDADSLITKSFSRSFIASCNTSRDYNIPFLYCDALPKTLKSFDFDKTIFNTNFISIPAICNYYEKLKGKSISQMLYKLLSGTTFISFKANTIIDIISENDYEVTENLIKPFLTCKSDYDMNSFANVYLSAIFLLKGKHLEAANSLTEIILNNAIKIWNRGQYYRFLLERNNEDLCIKNKVASISNYVKTLLHGVDKIFETPTDNISSLTSQLKELIE